MADEQVGKGRVSRSICKGRRIDIVCSGNWSSLLAIKQSVQGTQGTEEGVVVWESEHAQKSVASGRTFTCVKPHLPQRPL